MVDAKYAKIIDEIAEETKGIKRKIRINEVLRCACDDDDVTPLDFITLCAYSKLKLNGIFETGE